MRVVEQGAVITADILLAELDRWIEEGQPDYNTVLLEDARAVVVALDKALVRDHDDSQGYVLLHGTDEDVRRVHWGQEVTLHRRKTKEVNDE